MMVLVRLFYDFLMLVSEYLARRASVNRAWGPLFLSPSWRNHSQLEVVRRIAIAADVERISTHHPAPVPDGLCRDWLGNPRDRSLRRALEH